MKYSCIECSNSESLFQDHFVGGGIPDQGLFCVDVDVGRQERSGRVSDVELWSRFDESVSAGIYEQG
jgi:hypothetical protein